MNMAKSNKVVYASSDVTLHVALGSEEFNGNTVWNVESVVLRPGDTLPLDKLPPYQKEAVEAGDVPGVQVVSEKEGEKLSAAWSDAQPNPHILAFNQQTKVGPDADDGSFSDHELSDVERVANHKERGAAEAGEATDDSPATVTGADQADSPAQSGRKTRTGVHGEVQGSEGGSVEEATEGNATEENE
jgi:hypothetical protein